MTPRRQRMLLVALVIARVAVAVGLALRAFDDNLLYFYSPSEVVAGSVPTGKKFRLGGLVNQGSVERKAGDVEVRFVVTDMKESMTARDIKESIVRCLQREGLSFIEVLSPCPVNYGRRNKEKPLDTLAIYQNMTVIKNGISPAHASVDMKKGIVLGTFINEDRPTWQDMYDRLYRKE